MRIKPCSNPGSGLESPRKHSWVQPTLLLHVETVVRKIQLWLSLLVVVALLSWGGRSTWSAQKSDQAPSEKPATQEEQYYEMFRLFADSFEQIERNYVKEVDRRKLVEAALRGMLEELDPYSNYISPDELSKFNTQVEQEFGGVGLQVDFDPRSRRPIVTSPQPGTPAYKAGIKTGDLIMEIEGKSTEGKQVNDVVKLIRGKPGEKVTIGITHAGGDKIEQVTLERAIIHVPTVLGDLRKGDDSWNYMLDDEKKIGYIRLTAFARDSTRELNEALGELKKAGMKALVLDLRFNPGGLLSAATEISDLFIEEGKIVSTKGRNTQERVWNAKKEGTFAGFPMVVLINRFSASASEIVSACLQDHKRALVVGERSWGKGSVQNVIELESGKSALKLTTASYHRPSGKNIHKLPGAKENDEWGVMPNDSYKLDMNTDEMQQYLEYRRQRDIVVKDGPPKSEFVDKQLQKGIEYIVAQLAGEKKPDATAEAKKDEKKSDQ